MSLQMRQALLKQFAPQYRKASSKRKRLLLDAFAQATGYHRRYGMWLLNHTEEVHTRPRSQRAPRYGPEVQRGLFLVWHAANRICVKSSEIAFSRTDFQIAITRSHLIWADSVASFYQKG